MKGYRKGLFRPLGLDHTSMSLLSRISFTSVPSKHYFPCFFLLIIPFLAQLPLHNFPGLIALFSFPVKLYDLSLYSSTTTRVLALNIIESAAAFESLRRRRKTLNDLITAHQAERFYVCDLCSAIPYFDMDKEKRKEIWDDGLHLTEMGYRRMGEVVGSRLAEIINGDG